MSLETIKEGAIFLADSHHSKHNNVLDDFFSFLLECPKTQIFLMGDIFDFLVGKAPKSIQDNQNTLVLLEKLSQKHKIYYFEGNHDFCLKNIPFFKNIQCYPISKQPVCFMLNDQKAYLAHGDIFLNWHYNLYTKIIRNPLFLSFANCFDFFLYPKILQYLKNKKLHYPIYPDLIPNRIQKYQAHLPILQGSYIIEGHFHMGKQEEIETICYLGLPSFAKMQEYISLESKNNSPHFVQKCFKNQS